MIKAESYLGAGILFPFRRDGADDFANASGTEAVESSLRLIMGTTCAGPHGHGEVPFNQKLGTLLHSLRHRNLQDEATRDLATHYVLEGITVNEPRIRAKEMEFRPVPSKNKLVLKLTYDLYRRDRLGSTAVATDVESEFES